MIRFVNIDNGRVYNGDIPYVHWFDGQQSIDLIYVQKLCVLTDTKSISVRIPNNSVFHILDVSKVLQPDKNPTILDQITYKDIQIMYCNTWYSIGVPYEESGYYVHMIYIAGSSNVAIEAKESIFINNEQFTIGADFYDEREELKINVGNQGLELPESVQRAIYPSNVHEEAKDNILLNRKYKELLMDYISILGDRGSYSSLINSLNWFEYGDLLRMKEFWKHYEGSRIEFNDQEFSQVLQDTAKNMLSEYTKTTYLGIYCACQRMKRNLDGDIIYDLGTKDGSGLERFIGEGVPVLEQSAFAWSRLDMSIKMALLGNFYESYFMPVHLDLIHSTIEDVVFTNTIKVINHSHLDRVDHVTNLRPIHCNIKDGQEFMLGDVEVNATIHTPFINSTHIHVDIVVDRTYTLNEADFNDYYKAKDSGELGSNTIIINNWDKKAARYDVGVLAHIGSYLYMCTTVSGDNITLVKLNEGDSLVGDQPLYIHRRGPFNQTVVGQTLGLDQYNYVCIENTSEQLTYQLAESPYNDYQITGVHKVDLNYYKIQQALDPNRKYSDGQYMACRASEAIVGDNVVTIDLDKTFIDPTSHSDKPFENVVTGDYIQLSSWNGTGYLYKCDSVSGSRVGLFKYVSKTEYNTLDLLYDTQGEILRAIMIDDSDPDLYDQDLATRYNEQFHAFYLNNYSGTGVVIPFKFDIDLEPGDFISRVLLAYQNINTGKWDILESAANKEIVSTDKTGKTTINFELLCTRARQYVLKFQFTTGGSCVYTKQVTINVTSDYSPTIEVYRVKRSLPSFTTDYDLPPGILNPFKVYEDFNEYVFSHVLHTNYESMNPNHKYYHQYIPVDTNGKRDSESGIGLNRIIIFRPETVSLIETVLSWVTEWNTAHPNEPVTDLDSLTENQINYVAIDPDDVNGLKITIKANMTEIPEDTAQTDCDRLAKAIKFFLETPAQFLISYKNRWNNDIRSYSADHTYMIIVERYFNSISPSGSDYTNTTSTYLGYITQFCDRWADYLGDKTSDKYYEWKRACMRDEMIYIPHFHKMVPLFQSEVDENGCNTRPTLEQLTVLPSECLCVVPDIQFTKHFNSSRSIDFEWTEWIFRNASNGIEYRLPSIKEPFVAPDKGKYERLPKGYYDIIFRYRLDEDSIVREVIKESAFIQK